MKLRASGQILPLAALALLVLCFAALWLADVHRIVRVKDSSQNAGDAAALEAARWQAVSLNLAGDLNLAHAAAVAEFERRRDAETLSVAEDAITNAQARLMFAGPLTAFAAAQQAAKLNGVPANDDYTEFVRDCVRRIRGEYSSSVGGSMAMPEPYEGAWEDYAAMLSRIASAGVAAGPDNAAFYNDPAGAHILLDINFYSAVLGRDWCYFYRSAPGLLENYSGPSWWPALPDPDERPPVGSEFFPLGLRPRQRALSDAERELLGESFLDESAPTGFAPRIYYVYDESDWGAWTVMTDPSFPIDGELKREYDYLGADSVMRVETSISRLTSPEREDDVIAWVGAAKPFGSLPDRTGNEARPCAVGLALPVFSDVRLIPLDAASGGGGGTFNMKWRRHCAEHLPKYLASGSTQEDCRYCRALRRFEPKEFRMSGVRWLSTNSWKCTIAPPGGRPGGGSRHAH